MYDPAVVKVYVEAGLAKKLLPLLESSNMGLVVRACACVAAISEADVGAEALKKTTSVRKLEKISKAAKDPQLLQFVTAALSNLK